MNSTKANLERAQGNHDLTTPRAVSHKNFATTRTGSHAERMSSCSCSGHFETGECEKIANIAYFQENVHTVNLHHIQDKYFAQTRQLLLNLLDGNSLKQVTLYNLWLSDANLRSLMRLCAGLPTKDPHPVQTVSTLSSSGGNRFE